MNMDEVTRYQQFRQFRSEIRGSGEYLVVGIDMAKESWMLHEPLSSELVGTHSTVVFGPEGSLDDAPIDRGRSRRIEGRMAPAPTAAAAAVHTRQLRMVLCAAPAIGHSRC